MNHLISKLSRYRKITAILTLVIFVTLSVAFPRGAYAVTPTVVYLTSGTSWTVPSDWNSQSNTIEVIGGGGSGSSGSYGGTGSGGGGGGYSISINVALTPSTSVGYSVGAGGAGDCCGAQYGYDGGDTFFCNSTSNCASISGTAVVVGAKGGAGGRYVAGAGGCGTSCPSPAGGAAASGVGNTKYSGGGGGPSDGGTTRAGGGGAAGRYGNGEVGYYSRGGNGDYTLSTSGGGAGGTSGAGAAGTEWDATHGSGGGGGNAGSSSTGGLYGGGGGAGLDAASGAGAQGIIVISYTPTGPGTSLTFSGHVQFTSTLNVGGALAKGAGTFVIDHPLDPANMLLYHSFVESPDVKNIYDGIAPLDRNGEAVITLPDYFDALNNNVRYQFFALDQAMPNLYIKEEERNNRFTIGGGIPRGKVSWQITGVRHDAYILAHPVIVSVLKGPGELVNRGECIFGPLCK